MVDDLTAEQQKVDTDVEAVKARRVRDRDRMDQGLITNPKDLERMQQLARGGRAREQGVRVGHLDARAEGGEGLDPVGHGKSSLDDGVAC